MKRGTDMDELHADVLVIGAGMAGMTVGAVLAEAGKTVAVVDTAQVVGGSARLSEGFVWTAPSREVFAEQDPDGDVKRFEVMLEAMAEAFAWLEGLNVSVGPQLKAVLGFGEGRQIDVLAYLQRCQHAIERRGFILLDCEPDGLIMHRDRVAGATLRLPDSDDLGRVLASQMVIATGGFQGSPKLRDEWIFPGAGDMLLRSNHSSSGGGIALACSIGADLTAATPGFYGHLVPHPMQDLASQDYARLAQYHSEHGLLLGEDGRRFTDESLGDHVNTVVVARRGTALLLVDARITREQVMRPFIPGMEVVDKMAEAGSRGARYVSAPSLEQLVGTTAHWGYDAEGILRTVEHYNMCVESGAKLEPPRRAYRGPIRDAPFAALEVQAAITFTYRGLATDLDGRVLGKGVPIRGLWAVGADAGGLNVWGYTGGLVRGLVLGRRAAFAMLAESESGNDTPTSAS